MLTKLIIRNFKRFGEVEIDLGNPVVFIGPNNSGKTTALQALSLWDLGLRRWNEKRKGKAPALRSGVTINRRDLFAVPAPTARQIWKNLDVRHVQRINGEQETQNVLLDILVEGETNGKLWKCGLEFDYANEESFWCRPLRESEKKQPDRMLIPEAAANTRVVVLPPMSGLADREFEKQHGEIGFLIGQGRTAEVLRNICNQLATNPDQNKWTNLKSQIQRLFGVEIEKPEYIQERSEIVMRYEEQKGIKLDLSCSGRGLQQTLLLLSYLAMNTDSVLLLDEPDAHLEFLRQQEIYQLLVETAEKYGCQVIIASHSEVVLDVAVNRGDAIVSFVGKPHRIDDRGSQLRKALRDIRFDQYYLAEQKGWILYVEDTTDWSILKAFAEKLGHEARQILDRPFMHYIGNQPKKGRDHFRGLYEAKNDLTGFILCDNDAPELQTSNELVEYKWSRREIENYFCQKDVLLRWAMAEGNRQTGGPLLASQWESVMKDTIAEIETAMLTLGKGSPWSQETKVSDEFLNPLFSSFYKKLGYKLELRKADYYHLVQYMSPEQIDPEVIKVLNLICDVSSKAKPVVEEEKEERV